MTSSGHAVLVSRKMGKVDEEKFKQVSYFFIRIIVFHIHKDNDTNKQALRMMRDGASLNKAALSVGIAESTIRTRFSKYPELHDVVNKRLALDDDSDAEADDEQQMVLDAGKLSRGRGRPLDIPVDVEAALAKKVQRAIQRLNAPTTRKILRTFVKEVC